MHLGIDFLHMSMDFGRQVGRQNGLKIDPERHWKKDAKNNDSRGADLAPEIHSTRWCCLVPPESAWVRLGPLKVAATQRPLLRIP